MLAGDSAHIHFGGDLNSDTYTQAARLKTLPFEIQGI